MKKNGVSYPINGVGEIEPTSAQKLRAMRIRTSAGLLERAKNAKGRKALSERIDVPCTEILKWVNKFELMRVKGIGADYVKLLRASRVGTLRELRLRNPKQLAKLMAEVNKKKNLVRLVPSEKSVRKWIERAKELLPQITY